MQCCLLGSFRGSQSGVMRDHHAVLLRGQSVMDRQPASAQVLTLNPQRYKVKVERWSRMASGPPPTGAGGPAPSSLETPDPLKLGVPISSRCSPAAHGRPPGLEALSSAAVTPLRNFRFHVGWSRQLTFQVLNLTFKILLSHLLSLPTSTCASSIRKREGG